MASWERERRQRITRSELVTLFGTSRAHDVVRGLMRKHVLQRVGPGLYLVVPLRAHLHPPSPSSAVMIAALLADEPYYLGGLWAFSFHRLSQQQYGSRIDAFVGRRRRRRHLLSAEVVFHVLPTGALADGIQTVSMEGTPIRISGPERTILDALDHPEGLGGAQHALAMVNDALGRVDLRKLISLAAKGSPISTCQRLAVLLERRKVDADLLRPLGKRVPKEHSLASMIPGAPRRGHISSAWRIIENDR